MATPPVLSNRLDREWRRKADFLLGPTPYLAGSSDGLDYVVGNFPYVRLESIGPEVTDCQRKLFGNVTGRVDLHVGCYEQALGMLKPGGINVSAYSHWSKHVARIRSRADESLLRRSAPEGRRGHRTWDARS